jgi:hypothetical protein
MSAAPVTKIYKLSTLGYSELHTQLQQVTKDFDAIRKAKAEAEKAVSASKSTEELAKYRAELNKLKIDEQEAKTRRQQLMTDMKAQQQIRQAELQQMKEEKKALQDNAQGYNAVVKEAKEFYALLKNTPKDGTLSFKGQLFTYDQAIAKYKELSAAEQAFRRQFAQDQTLVGEYTSGIVRAFKSMGLDDLIGGQVTKANQKLSSLAVEANELKTAFQQIRQQGQTGFDELNNRLNAMGASTAGIDERFTELDRILKQTGGDGVAALNAIEQRLIANATEAGTLRQQVGLIQAELRGTGDIGDRITAGLANGFKNLKGQVAQFALSFLGVQAALNAVVGTFADTKKLTDQYADLQRVLGVTNDEFTQIREQVKNIDTRTGLNDLFDTATIAARAGVAKENIAGVTKAIDQLKQVAGNELGDVDAATTSIVKLINIFNGPGQVTEQNVLKFGNALVELANAGVASGGFLVDYAQRLAGIQGMTGITIKSVLGLAAAFEEQGQSAEVSATATTQILGKIGADVAKYARIAQQPIESYRALLRSNPAEALLRLAEGLKGNATAFDEIAPKFADLEAKGVRVQQVFGVMADKADFFRQKIAIAGDALENTTAIIEGAQAKQETFAGTLDKISKSFATAFSSAGFLNVLNAVASALLFIVKIITAIPFAVVITGLTLATAAWAYYKGNVISATIAQAANNEATLLGTIRKAAERLGILSVTAATEAQVVATEAATVATEELNAASKASPLGIILAIIALLIPALTAFGSKLSGTTSELNKQNEALKGYANINKQLQASIQEQTSKTKENVSELINIIKTEVDNVDLRKRAYEALIKISPEFIGTLDAQYQATDRLNKAYEAFVINLDKVARAQAIKNTKQKIEDDRAAAQAEVFQARIEADAEKANNKVVAQSNKALFDQALSSSNLGAAGAAAVGAGKTMDDKAKAYQAALAKAKNADEKAKAFSEFMKTASDDDKKALIDGLGGNQSLPASVTENGEQTIEVLKQKLAEVDAQIKQMDSISNKDKAQLKQLKELRAQRAEILKEIKELGGGDGKARAARLSAGETDDLNGLEAQRKNELAQLELYYARIRKYRDLDVDEQVAYVSKLRDINNRYDLEKIAAITGNNAKEQAARAELNKGIIDNEIATEEKIKAIYKKAFDEKAALLKQTFENEASHVHLKVQVVEDDPDATFEQRARAQQQGNIEQLNIANDYYANLEAMARLFGQKIEGIELERQKAIADITRKGLDDAHNIIEAKLKDIEVAYDRTSASIQDKYDYLISNILSRRLSTPQRDVQLDQLGRLQTLEQATAKLKAAQKAYTDIVLQPVRTDGSNDISNDVAQKLHDAVVKAQKELDDAIRGITPKANTLKDLFTNKLSKLFNFDINTDIGKAKSALLAETITAAFDTAGNAMNAYYDMEANRIQQSLKLQEKRLDIETGQRLARAQSQAEEESINKQAQERKEALEKEAFEKQKKMQVAQAEVNLAIQLSNLAVIAFAPNPLNIATLGTFGAIMYAIQAALAFANFAANVGKIKSAQFEYGGVPKRGGRFGGKSHAQGGTPFGYHGEQYEAEVDELAVIRTRNAPRNKVFSITGTQSQIASGLNQIGGGVSFEPGATIKKFALGGAVNSFNPYPAAPQFSAPSYFFNAGNNADVVKKLQELKDKFDDHTRATDERIDRMEVVQVTESVTAAQKKAVRQSNMGTLGTRKTA